MAIDERALRGRAHELAELEALVAGARDGRSGTLVVAGDAGIGKTALLERAAEHARARVQVRWIAASQYEMELAYAGLQQLCGPMLDAAGRLPGPQREALEVAFGLRAAPAPSSFLVGLAVLGLLTEVATEQPLLCVVDDAMWLDAASAQAFGFVARRLEAEGIAVVFAMRTVSGVFEGLPRLTVPGLGDEDAREVLRRAVPGPLDPRVRDQLVAEARGNPLALQELPHNLGGGFALAEGPLESRIEQSLLAQLDPLPEPARLLLVLAAADPTGDPELLRRASALLGLGPEDVDAAERAGALVVGTRVGFRHPLVRSAVYRAASPAERREVHAALAEATPVDRDPDRRAWHRASATAELDEDVAADLERSAARARTRGGAAATAAFLERAAELTPDAAVRADRVIAAAEAKHDAGAPEAALRLLDVTRGQRLSARQEALIARIRARAAYALRRESSAPRELLAAAQGLDGVEPALARDTYMEALAAAVYGGRLADAEQTAEVSRAILAATRDGGDHAPDLMLRGQALLAAEGFAGALPTMRRALAAFAADEPGAFGLHWLWFASRAAVDLWDAESMRTFAYRQVELARAEGILTVLPMALVLELTMRTLDGRLDLAEAACEEIDAIQAVTGNPLPPYARLYLAAYRGDVAETERRAREIRRLAEARGEGYALMAANFASAIAYNGTGRYEETVACMRRELPYTHELAYAARGMLELVEAAVRVGDEPLATEAFERLAAVTRPLGTDMALGAVALAEAQLRLGDAAEELYVEAIDRYERERIPMLAARSRLLYGEFLRRARRRVDARAQLRPAYESLSRCGFLAFADRAARELVATGETLRVRTPHTRDELTPQERNVARLAREGLTNRDIGARLFISDRTVEYHLRKVYAKLGISSRADLGSALADTE